MRYFALNNKLEGVQMIRIEVIPYSNLDERYELSNRLAEARCKNKFKKLKDLGNCFYIEHFGMTNNIRV